MTGNSYGNPGFITMPPTVTVAAPASGSKLPSHCSTVDKHSQAEQSAANVPTKAEHYTLPFTQSQLCLALSIQRSKPTDINTRDYCLQLQNHVKQGTPTANRERRFIDTTEFWKDQYSKIHSEKKAMEVRLANLQTITAQDKPDYEAAIMEPCSLSTTVVDHERDILPDDTGYPNLPLLKAALKLHRLTQDDKVATDVLVSAIQSSLTCMNSAISQACKVNHEEPNGSCKSTNDRSLHTFNTVAAVFNMCLKGLTHLCRHIPGRRCKGQVIFSLVQFFVRALGHLHNMCVQATVYQVRSISNHQHNAPHGADSKDTSRSRAPISGLTTFLINVLTCPDFQMAHVSHTEVLEGMFSALLEEVGGLISQVVFDEQTSALPGPSTVSWSDKDAPAFINALAIDLKCRHFAVLLKRVVDGRPEKDKNSLAALLAGTKVLGIGVEQKLILARARQRLQETLMKGIFGDDGEDFMNALQLPESGDGLENEVPQVPRDDREAFLESVWSIVGWDMILKD